MDTVLTRKKYPSPINHPVYEFTMRSLYKIPAMDYKGFITLSHKFTQVKLSVKVKGYYIKLLHPTNRNAYLVYCWETVKLMQLAEHSFLMRTLKAQGTALQAGSS